MVLRSAGVARAPRLRHRRLLHLRLELKGGAGVAALVSVSPMARSRSPQRLGDYTIVRWDLDACITQALKVDKKRQKTRIIGDCA